MRQVPSFPTHTPLIQCHLPALLVVPSLLLIPTPPISNDSMPSILSHYKSSRGTIILTTSLLPSTCQHLACIAGYCIQCQRRSSSIAIPLRLTMTTLETSGVPTPSRLSKCRVSIKLSTGVVTYRNTSVVYSIRPCGTGEEMSRAIRSWRYLWGRREPWGRRSSTVVFKWKRRYVSSY